MKKSYVLWIIGTSSLVVLIVLFSIFSFTQPKSNVVLYVAPFEMSLRIDSNNDISVKNEQKIYLSSGKHTLIFSRQGFQTQTKEVNIENDNSKNRIVLALEPTTEEAKKYMEDNKTKFSPIFEMLTMVYFKDYQQKITQKYPIISILPLTTRLYVVNYCPSLKNPDDIYSISLCVTTNQEDILPVVEQHLKNLGYNPSDYEISIKLVE